MSPAEPVTDPASQGAWRLAAVLAEALAHPLATFHPAQIRLAPLSDEVLVGAAVVPHFSGPLNRAASRQLGLADLPLGADFFDRLATRPLTRLAVLLVVEPIASIAAAALLVAGAVMHRSLVAVVLGSQRARLRAALGDAAFDVATREALLLHAPLVAAAGREPLPGLDDEAALRDGLVERGTRALHGAVASSEPALADLLVRRFRPGWPGVAQAEPFTADIVDHLLKLLRRRMPAWAASIA